MSWIAVPMTSKVSSTLTIQPQSVHRSYCNVFTVPACTHALGEVAVPDITHRHSCRETSCVNRPGVSDLAIEP